MIDVRLTADTDGAMRKLKNLEARASQAEDEVAEELAEDGVRRGRRALIRQGSVATSQGIESLEAERLKRGVYGVLGMNYLHLVDRGTKPHRPDADYRFRVWAQTRGFTVGRLQEIIEQKGTKPHPWERDAFRPLRKAARKKSLLLLKRRLMQAL